MSRSALERQAMRSARSGTLPVPTSAPAGFLSGVDDHIAEEQQQEAEEPRNDVLPIHGNDRTFNLNTLLAQTILASEYFKGLAGITTHLEVRRICWCWWGCRTVSGVDRVLVHRVTVVAFTDMIISDISSCAPSEQQFSIVDGTHHA